ncbi:MAG: hypothetical protein KGL38_00515 [Gemmatimonadota bacterium]|nr:hypothetical protein [Gemmatimonadota bacterium]MDE3126449.1 hypothetical protein [Gemmatimonadota bacterium]MDE3172605.1 hypothetical protein [Gemmatimonadota bacterium]MDE3215425.1 hypothetical protein [Gemmatimonadota bacterium]
MGTVVERGAGVLAAAGWIRNYRLYDVGYAIDLERAARLMPSAGPVRLAPSSAQAVALQIPNPPLLVSLGTAELDGWLGGATAQLSARLYDFGAIAVRARVAPAAERLDWPAFIRFARDVEPALQRSDPLGAALRGLVERIGPAVVRPRVAPVTEEYTVFHLKGLWSGGGDLAGPAALDDARLASLLLEEDRPLSASARTELLPHRLSYHDDDLAVLTWEHALVLAPGADEETDIEWVLEFANAQLLELRYYDAVLDDALPRMYDDVARARRGVRALVWPRVGRVLPRLSTLHADTTETVERVENALRVTDDVYLARVYTAAMEVFRGPVWREGIDRKLDIIRNAYAMLNEEAQVRRSELLEAMIVVLIVVEIVMALVR